MKVLTAADYADTGQWRLIVNISLSGISAYIENTIHNELEPELLFSAEWDADGDNLLRNIENAVYDHPRVLDDFSARIIIYDPRTLFIPTALTESQEGIEEVAYTSVYSADPADVMTDIDRDITAAHCLAPGLKGFLSRTFPGAKIESNLMDKVRTLRKNNRRVCMFVEAREHEADFILLDGENLLSASTHPAECPDDVAYHALNIIDVYGLDVAATPVEVCGRLFADEINLIVGRVRNIEN